jgi:hypothetical protein
MSRDRAIRALAGGLVVVVAAAGFLAATSDELMVGGTVAAGFFVVAGLSGLAVALTALVPSAAAAAQPIAASAGIFLALVAILMIPFTAARSVCGCTEPPAELLPPPPFLLGSVAPHDLVSVTAIAAPLLLLVAANVGRGRRRPMADELDGISGTAAAPERPEP